MSGTRVLDAVALILAIVGAINWGLVGLFEFDLVAEIVGEEFGEVNAASRIIYILVALAGLYLITTLARLFSDTERPYATEARR